MNNCTKRSRLKEYAKWWFRILEVRRQRMALLALDDTLLSDVGISREAAVAEAKRPVWDFPERIAQNCDQVNYIRNSFKE